jgi:hypothetical protein
MRARRSVLWLGAAACLAAGCDAIEPRAAGQVTALDDETFVIEGPDGVLSAHDPSAAVVRWRYQPPSEPFLPFLTRPPKRLVCPIERTPSGALLLRYESQLVAVDSRTTKTLWVLDVPAWATLGRRCPRATLDSGVLLLRAHGLILQKVGRMGATRWMLQLGSLGAALAPPVVSAPSGDALLQTRDHLVNVSPEGTFNWVRPR